MVISVVMTTYNGEEYVTTQLDSLLKQTKSADEILIFDDGSTDSTVETVRKYIEDYHLDHWKLIVNKINKGWRRNFFEGICKAKGDIIFPCDQDDIWEVNKLELMEKVMREHTNIEVLVSNYRIYDTDKIIPCRNDGRIMQIKLNGNIFFVPYPGCTFCIRKSFVDDIKKYWNDSFPHDAFFWRFALLRKTLFSLNINLIDWRIHNDSSFSVEKTLNKNVDKKLKWIEYAEVAIASLQDYLNENDINDDNLYNVLDRNKEWLDLRKRLFTYKDVKTWFRMFRYLKYYPKRRQYIYDFYYMIK